VAAHTTFNLTVETTWAAVALEWGTLIPSCAGTPFQRFAWLDAWYNTIGNRADLTPLLVKVTETSSGQLVMLLPLVLVVRNGLRCLQFADQDLSDYNAPLLGPIDVAAAQYAELWRAIIGALPRCDLVEFRKQPHDVAGRANPLVSLAGATRSSLHGNILRFSGSWTTQHAAIERRVRMELERCWRIFQREPSATFTRVLDVAEALSVIDLMDQQQRQRLAETGAAFALDQPTQAAFYRHNLAQRLGDGSVIITALRSSGELIAALYAIADGRDAIVLRIAHAGKSWSKMSPGRLVVHGTFELLCREGYASVDLSIGDYDYKRRFGVAHIPLTDLVAALSWRGQAVAARHWVVGQVRSRPELDARLRRWLGHLRRPANRSLPHNA
jgi:CelD/BcsL family acetyltransferase involved in cellulose biosynthesis